MKTIDVKSGRPFYQQVKEDLIGDIKKGAYPAHNIIPSENQLCRSYGISVGTVKRALLELVKESYLYRHQGKGTFVSSPEERKRINPSLAKTILFFPLVAEDFYAMELLQGIRDHFHKHAPQYEISTEFVSEEAELLRCLHSPLLKGVIVPIRWEGEKSFLKDIKIPAVVLNCICKGPRRASVRVDNRAGGYETTVYLLRKGYKRIGFLRFADSPVCEERFAGYKKALRDHNIPPDESLIIDSTWTRESGYLSGLKLLETSPEAIFAPGYYMALGVIDALEEKGMRIPDDMAVFGFDSSKLLPKSRIPLTTVRQPVFEMGSQAAEMLVRMMEGKPLKKKHIILPTQMISGNTA